MATRRVNKTQSSSKRSISTFSLQTVQTKILKALREAIEEARGSDQASLFTAAPQTDRKVRIIVGFSGGRDSVALLKALCVLKDKKNSPIEALQAVHVHHAISANANKWARFCRRMAEELEVDFKVAYVRVKNTGEGVEAAARQARYDAIFKAAHAFNADMVMTAHHQDDRLETFLIQWMRGSGVDGLATFPVARDVQGIKLVRPLMGLPRELLERYLELTELTWVDDESNADTAYLRNAIRHEVLPVMQAIRPGFKEAAARSVELVAQSAQVLREVTQEDLKKAQDSERGLSIDFLLALSEARQALVLRAWIESFGLMPPTKAKLDDLLKQVRLSGHDTKLAVKVGGNLQVRRHGLKLLMREMAQTKKDKTRFETLVWQGAGRYSLPSWSGELVITEVEGEGTGIAEEYFENRVLEARPRQGGEKLKLYKNRPRKHLKDLYQKAGIAEFDRPNLPLLWSGEELLFAAGLGMDVRYETDNPEVKRYRIEWKPDATLLTLMQP